MAEAMVHTEESQPVLPAPVDTMMPLDDWRSHAGAALFVVVFFAGDEVAGPPVRSR